MKVTGKVVGLDSKVINRPGKRPFTVHSVILDNGKTINVGFKQPFRVDQEIAVDCEMAYGELKMGAPAPAEGSSSGTTPPAKGGYSSGKNDKFPVPVTHGDYAIIRQNALTAAVNFIGNSADPYNATEEMAEAVIKVAYKFADFTSGHREEKLARSIGAKTMTSADGS